MTVGVAYRVPGQGAVLVSDGRVTHCGEIVSDSARKYCVCGSTAVLVAGTVGPIWRRLQERPPRNFSAFRAVLDADPGENDWLAYDRRNDRLWLGDARIMTSFSALGSGSSLALGALEAHPIAKSMAEAERLAVRAVRAACRRHTECGGRLRVLIVPRRGPIKVA